MPNAFLSQSKSRMWPTGIAHWAGEKVRVQDALGIVFDTYLSPMETNKANFLTSAALKACLIRDVVQDDWSHLLQTLSFLFGYDLPLPIKIAVSAEKKLEIIQSIIQNDCRSTCTIVAGLFAFKGTDVPHRKNGKGAR